jgi:hypothetical protein
MEGKQAMAKRARERQPWGQSLFPGQKNSASRREFLRRAARVGGGLAGWPLWGAAAAEAARGARPSLPARAGLGAGRGSGAAPTRRLLADIPVQWQQANPAAILIDAGQDAWHAGHVNDLLVLPDGSGLIAGAETGGVWVITNADQAIPLSDTWDDPDVNCLAAGPDGPRHLYAGCSSTLYETNAASAVPLFDWHPVPLPGGAGAVLRIGVLNGPRLIVLACWGGLFWSAIPAAGGSYTWKAARRAPSGPYSGLTFGPGGSVIAAVWGSLPEQGLCGIFHGDWSTGELVMRRSFLQGVCAADMYRTTVAACANQPNLMYAVSANPGNAWIYAVLKSSDGGRTWNRLPARGTRDDRRQSGPLESTNPDLAGGQGNYNQCLAVSPTDPNRIVLGWRNGPWFSQDGGLNWRYTGDNNPHVHGDLHAVLFDPTDPGGTRLYAGSDGGVIMTPDLGRSYVSNYNRALLNLQFLSPTGRSFWGIANASYQVSGLVAGGLQDNGGAYCRLGPDPTPWLLTEGGDGGSALFIRTGQLLYNDVAEAIQSATWNGSGMDPHGVIPVRGARPNPNGLVAAPVEIVNSPQYRNGAGQWMFAVAGVTPDVYGLFADGDGSDLHWEYLVSLPIGTEGIGALGSGNGLTIYTSTGAGRIFATSPTGPPQELNVVPRRDGNGTIPRIIVQSETLAFAIFNRGGGGLILRLNGPQWEAMGSGLPDTTFYGMDTDWTILPKPLFVATDDQVYVSRDDGNTWQAASQGLPRRVHGSDVRFVSEPGGAKYLYLSTYGRSLWRARLG